MYEIKRSTQFKRDVRRSIKQHKLMTKFKTIHELLMSGMSIPETNKDHILSGNWNGHRECHIEPDWLLIYRIDRENKVIEYVRMGSHSDIFS